MPSSDDNDDIIRLGCPFCARNPQRYRDSRSCSGAGFTQLSQVKDHLKRVHPAECPESDCHFVIADNPIEEHARQHPNCKFRPKAEIEYMTVKQWEDVRKVPRRCRDTSPGEQWRVIFSKLFGDDVPAPPPYLPSLDQYRRIAATPPQELLSALQIRILNSGQTVPFHIEQNSLRVCLGLLVPALFDLVSEHGLLPSSSAPMPIPQQFPQPTIFFPEGDLDGPATHHDHDFHDDAERLLALADTW